MNPWPISPITRGELDFRFVNYDLTTFTADALAEEPGLESSIDSLLADFAASIAEQTVEIPVLFDGLDDLANILGEIDTSPLDGVLTDLAQTAAHGDAFLSDFEAEFSPPSSGGGGGGGGGTQPASSDCSQRTNQYGLSTTGNFPGITCNWQLTFQVFRVQDGPCTYSAAPAAQVGDSHLPTIGSFTLQSGDTGVFQLSHHTAKATDGSPYDVIDVTITPKAQGHFDGVGVLSMNGGARTWHVCMSVDFIP